VCPQKFNNTTLLGFPSSLFQVSLHFRGCIVKREPLFAPNPQMFKSPNWVYAHYRHILSRIASHMKVFKGKVSWKAEITFLIICSMTFNVRWPPKVIFGARGHNSRARVSFFQRYWGLNSEPCTWQARTLSFGLHSQPFLL
jgi:hypothetical protein